MKPISAAFKSLAFVCCFWASATRASQSPDVSDPNDSVPAPEHLVAAKIADEKVLTPPLFITEKNVFFDADQRINIALPHPNSDGWDPTHTIKMEYLIKVVQDCNVFYSIVVTKENYPYIFKIPFEIPFPDFEIQISRQSRIAKRNDQSSGVVIRTPASARTAIPENPFEIDRWLLHAPRKAGGFEGTIVFNNRFPTLPTQMFVAGFDAAGQLVPGSETSVVVIGHRPELALYGNSNTGLFPTNLQDKVSHIGLMEEEGSHFIDTSITYKNTQDGSLTATVGEVSLASGDVAGSQFTLEARKSTEFWDGLAITNLSSQSEGSVDVVMRRLSDQSEIARKRISGIEPGGKVLSVVSDLFPFTEDAYYTVETTSPTQKVQVLGLRGSASEDTPLLVGSKVYKTQ